LAWAHQEKAHMLKEESKLDLALKHQEKACLLHNKNYKKTKPKDKSTNLIQCYYFLTTIYQNLKQYNKAISASNKAIEIFDSYDKNKISDLAGTEQMSWQIIERAQLFQQAFEYDKAIADYKRFLHLITTTFKNQIGSKRHINAVDNLISIFSKKGDTKNTFKYSKLKYDMVYEYQSNNLLLLAEANNVLAGSYLDYDEWEESIKFSNKSLKIIDEALSKQNLNYETKKSYFNKKNSALINILVSSSNIKADKKEVKRIALEILKSNDHFKLLDKTTTPYERLHDYYLSVYDYDQAQKTLTQAYDLLDKQILEAKKTNQQWMLEFFYNSKRWLKIDEAYLNLGKGKFTKAIELAKELEKYETKDTGGSEVYKKVDLLNIYGRSYQGLNKPRKAINYYLKAMDILNASYEKNYDQETSILNNLALAYQDIGESDLAAKYMEQVVKRGEKDKSNPIYLVRNYNNYAVTSFHQDSNKALQYALKAYYIFQKSDPQHKKTIDFVNNINFIGTYYKSIGINTEDKVKKLENYKKAEKYFSEAIDFVKANYEKNIFPYSEFLLNYSDLAALLYNDFDTCIKYQEATVKQIEQVNDKAPELIRNYDLLWSCHHQLGEIEVAFSYLFKEMLILLNEFDKNNFELNFFINDLIKNSENAVAAFTDSVLLYSHENPEILKKYKLRFSDLIFALQQVIKTNELSVNLSQAISREMSKNEKISSDIKLYTSLLKKREELIKIKSIDEKEIKNINLEIKKINDEIDHYKNKILTDYPEFKKNFVNQIASIKGTQENLKEDEALIQYTIGRFGSFAFLITSDNYGIMRFKRSGRQKITEKINKIRSSLQLSNNKPKSFAKKESEELFDTLFSRIDAKDMIKGKNKIIIVPDGPLYALPFELLFDKENQKWLMEKYAVTISPSVYSFSGLNKNVEFNTANSFVGFGDPKIRDTKLADNSKLKNTIELEFSELFTRGGNVNLKYLKLFPELPETEIELKSIASKFDKNSKLYLREDFNENNINSINLKKYKVVSFASHALVVGEIDGLSEPAIVLSLPKKATVDNDGLLTTSEIIKLDLDSDLVILSACNTASSSGKTNSEALSGLATSFFYSGARSLLVTHWSIISETSVDLVSDTFDYLAETNGDLSLALTKAKIKMMENKKTSHPIYWAPYTLVGRSQINKL